MCKVDGDSQSAVSSVDWGQAGDYMRPVFDNWETNCDKLQICYCQLEISCHLHKQKLLQETAAFCLMKAKISSSSTITLN